MGEEEKTYLKHPFFPNSDISPFEITSPESPAYNCVAWAVGQTETWWEAEAGFAWLPQVPAENRMSTLKLFFENFGFSTCFNALPETGFEKIALFSSDSEHCSHVAGYYPMAGGLPNWEKVMTPPTFLTLYKEVFMVLLPYL